jgi:hypothetical protein
MTLPFLLSLSYAIWLLVNDKIQELWATMMIEAWQDNNTWLTIDGVVVYRQQQTLEG